MHASADAMHTRERQAKPSAISCRFKLEDPAIVFGIHADDKCDAILIALCSIKTLKTTVLVFRAADVIKSGSATFPPLEPVVQQGYDNGWLCGFDFAHGVGVLRFENHEMIVFTLECNECHPDALTRANWLLDCDELCRDHASKAFGEDTPISDYGELSRLYAAAAVRPDAFFLQLVPLELALCSRLAL
jgi:hypothetical protein